ncbi:HlyD family efflux transporter periplasmic adaptor subunit [Nocardioides sp. NPDC126508]
MRRPASRWVKATSGVATLAVLAGCGYVAYAASTDPADGFRLAAASTGDVEQTLSLTGTVAPNGRADLSFASSGTVDSVVDEGDTVKEGQVLARLDRTELTKTLTTAKASLAAARAQLASDKEAQVSGVSSTSTGATDSGGTASPSSTTSISGSGTVVAAVWTGTSTQTTQVSDTDVVAQVKALQATVVSAQKAVDSAGSELTSAKEDLSAAIDMLTALVSSGGTLDDGGALAQALEKAKTACASSEADTAAGCTGDLDEALAAQGSAKGTVTDTIEKLSSAQSAVDRAKEAVTTAKDDLATATGDLDSLLASSSAGGTSDGVPSEDGGTQGGSGGGSGEMPGQTEGGTQGGTSGAMPGGTDGQGSTAGDAQSGTMGGTGQTVTAATIAQDQATIDQAKVDVIEAKKALAGAVIKAPADGTVAAVDVQEGSTATSGTSAVTVIAKGLTSVELSVTASQLSRLAVGQEASISPAGVDKDLSGSVTLVGQVPDTSSGSSTFPVTVTLDEEGLDLLAGNTATVEVVLGSAQDVLTVPASAVSDGSVTVVGEDGTTERVRVTTGLTGKTTVEVTDGLDKGQEIVLADLSTPLPTGDTSSDGRSAFSTGGGSGGFGGGGPGGVPGGMPGGGQR